MSAARAQRLSELVAVRELDALLVTQITSVRYLTGFTGTNGLCIVGSEGEARRFVTDFRYLEQAEAQVQGYERAQGKQDLLGEATEGLAGRVGFEDQHVSVRQLARLEELLGDRAELVSAGGLVEELRAVKEPEELEAIRQAATLADSIYDYLVERGLTGRTEREVVIDLEHQMRERGAEDPSFPSIVACGAHGALPHASPRDEVIPAGTLVVVDMGCRVDCYCSVCTRTFATGPLDGQMQEVYDLVLEAQEAALVAVTAGAQEPAVDAVARDLISAAGYGEQFGHGLGHGVGLEVHEAPRLAPSAEGSLEAANVVTVEPGVYVPGSFGVRIEDLAVVGENGPEVLTGFTKSLVTL